MNLMLLQNSETILDFLRRVEAAEPVGDHLGDACRITSYNVCYTKLLRGVGAVLGLEKQKLTEGKSLIKS